jgi:hypothetical protein
VDAAGLALVVAEPPQFGAAPAAVCFTGNGVGWAAATHGGRYEVLVSLDGGRSWRVALASTALLAHQSMICPSPGATLRSPDDRLFGRIDTRFPPGELR